MNTNAPLHVGFITVILQFFKVHKQKQRTITSRQTDKQTHRQTHTDAQAVDAPKHSGETLERGVNDRWAGSVGSMADERFPF